MTSTAVEVSVGPWRAAVRLGAPGYAFEPAGWLTHDEKAGPPLRDHRSAVVELRRSGGGLMPWALLAGEYAPDASGRLRVRVAHSGPLIDSIAHDCVGMLDRALATGLPEEFAQAALAALVEFDSRLNRSGALSVHGGAYHEADSSEFAFRRAAALLKWVLLGAGDVDAVSEVSLEAFLGSRMDR